jgi:hypothetical protein
VFKYNGDLDSVRRARIEETRNAYVIVVAESQGKYVLVLGADKTNAIVQSLS